MKGLLYYSVLLSGLMGFSLATSPTKPTSTQAGLTTQGQQGNCTKSSPCRCTYADGTVVDLTPLSKNDGTAYFSNRTAKNGYIFYWNPCNPFSYPKDSSSSLCGNVAVCMLPPNATKNQMNSLGTQITATYTKDKGGLHLSYAATKGKHSYAANIILRCNQTLQTSLLDVDTVPPYVTNTTSVYSFILNSKYACRMTPTTSPKTTQTPSRSEAASVKTVPLVLLCAAILSMGVFL